MGGDLSASTGDIRDRDIRSSPVRSSTAAGRRSQPNTEYDDATDSGMGLKEMEKNFDLKLELYHRRERQDALEEKTQKLEAENAEMRGKQEIFTKQLAERDKAIGEAVDMIVRLEAKVNGLIREKEMVRQVEFDGSYCHSRSDQSEHLDDEGAPLTPKMKGLEFFGMMDGNKSLERMPSFLSERSQQTENLRNVVLGGLSSLAHMRRVSETSVDPSDINRIASPSLSVLSESSFVSVYGSKNENGELATSLETDPMDMNNTRLEGLSTPVRESGKQGRISQGSEPASWTPKGAPPGSASLSTRMQPLTNVIDTTSPLQKLEMLEKKLPKHVEISRSSTFGQARGMPNLSPARSARPAHATTRQEKRDSIQRIITTGPTHKELANSHVLPPTPDTVASSTLRKHKDLTDSQDSLREGSFPARPNRSDTFGVNSSSRPSPKMNDIPDQRASITAFTGRINLPMSPINTHSTPPTNKHASVGLPPRPRSADESTISRQRANSWASDTDSDDGGVDAHSEESAFDYWMRESIRPNENANTHQRGLSIPTRAAQTKKGERRPSPDLFSFPTDSRGWGTDVIFSALRGNGFLGSPAPELKRERIIGDGDGDNDDLTATSFEEAPKTAVFAPQDMDMVMEYAPPTPDRRSSLHARTGSSSVVRKKTPVQNPSASNWAMMTKTTTKGRSNSIDSAAQAQAQVHFQQPEVPPSPGPGSNNNNNNKRNHQYPPLSGQGGMRRSLGLNSIFRRSGSGSGSGSLSESQGPLGAATPAGATEETAAFPSHNKAQLPPHVVSMRTGRSSVPPPPTMPWARGPPSSSSGASRLGIQEDELHSSATPPPILRNRGLSQPPVPAAGPSSTPLADSFHHHHQRHYYQQQQQQQQQQGGQEEETAAPPSAGGSSNTSNSNSNSNKRRWLNIARNSLKSRTPG
ncbi:hypothetical protein SLS62_008990 [Diatrype stigma]|uniref:Centrosomin N-terminal motif 1 domain-containing protein n=1 Tax=Diatrype stigma TaxID=117547 RepID=A0AAN9YM31_9PEZI